MTPYLTACVFLVIAYLLGSLPTGFLVGKAHGIDIRDHGSGSTGATNVWRTIGKKEGIFVWLVDSAKGYLGVWVMANLDRGLGLFPNATPLPYLSWWVVGAALLVLLGHSRSVWIGFRGGKSVASGLGVLVALNPIVAVSAFGLWLGSMAIWRTVSISSILAALTTPLAMYWLAPNPAYITLTLLGGAFVIWRHRSNIERILEGTEPRLSLASPPSSPE